MNSDALAALQTARTAKRPVVFATRLPDGYQVLLPDATATAALNAAALRALARRPGASPTAVISGTSLAYRRFKWEMGSA